MKKIALIVLTFILLALPGTALADVAPPSNPPGSNLQPGTETTQVRMAAETVLIDVTDDGGLGRARITADFTMRNLGTESESMAVRFPITANDGFGNYPEITDLIVKVGGQQIPYRRASYPDIRYLDQDVPWAEFNITFPAGQDVAIQVAYNIKGSGYMPFTAFYYILESGAGWQDTIGSADIILRLPYEASTQNVIMDLQIGWAQTPRGGVIDGNEVRWHFDDFEPGLYGPIQNMEFALVAPLNWETVLKERTNVAKTPDDSEAWGRLAKSYKDIFLLGRGYRTDVSGEELYQLSIEAYEKCLALNPNDAQWHAGFADLLATRSYFDSWSTGYTDDTFRALKEIQTALQLAPKDPKVLEIAEKIYFLFPDGMTQNGTEYDFPWLTQTPTPIPPTPTIVPALDAALVSGTYLSDPLDLANGTKAQLTLTLSADHSAELVTHSEDGQAVPAQGSWTDNGDGTLTVSVADQNQNQTEFKFKFNNESLVTDTYPAFYGEAGVNMQRVVTATPVPAATATLAPAPAASTPQPQATNPLCGSAALIGLLWLALKRR